MLSYRHAYHAGNLADVLKHVLLTGVLTAAAKKPKPLFYLDTHAGPGACDLGADRARGEHVAGIGALERSETSLPGVVAAYLDCVMDWRRTHGSSSYPGSIAIAAHLLRGSDRLVAAERHPEDARELRRRFENARNVRVVTGDGYALLRSELPPREGRGVVLIDPAYERGSEADAVVSGLDDALSRFGHGTLLVWYPRRGKLDHRRLVRRVQRLVETVAGASLLHVELGAPDGSVGATASAVLLVNPPYAALSGLEDAHRWLVEHLGGRVGSWTWLRGGALASARG
jgi:23S rRNA (adenine2030-N6)-methyltransferase